MIIATNRKCSKLSRAVFAALLVCIHCVTLASTAREELTTRTDLEQIPTSGPLAAAQMGSAVYWSPTLNETSVTQVMADLEKWEIRNLYIEAFADCRTIFPSANFESRSDGADWLELICTEAAKHHIRVIASMDTLLWRSSDSLTTPVMLSLHPNWIDISRDGSTTNSRNLSLAVNPLIPEVQKLLLGIVDEISSCSIAGISIDHITYNDSNNFGYNETAVKEFKALTSLDPYELDGDSVHKPERKMWDTYREDALTSLVHKLAFRIRQDGIARGERLLVCSTFVPDTAGKLRNFQNWNEWISRHYLDVSNPMCWNPSLSGLEKELREVRSVHQGSDVACLPALAVGKTGVQHSAFAEQKKVLEGVGFRHALIYDYETLRAEMEAVRQKQLKDKAD